MPILYNFVSVLCSDIEEPASKRVKLEHDVDDDEPVETTEIDVDSLLQKVFLLLWFLGLY